MCAGDVGAIKFQVQDKIPWVGNCVYAIGRQTSGQHPTDKFTNPISGASALPACGIYPDLRVPVGKQELCQKVFSGVSTIGKVYQCLFHAGKRTG